MASDRDDRLRRAETLVRQGRLDDAVAEYERLLESAPGDVATDNALGDALVRLGRSPEAVRCFMRVGDHYLREGFFAKAAGFYKKVLKLDAEFEPAQLNLAEAASQLGLIADARRVLAHVASVRRRRGDAAGADALMLRSAELDPKDLGSRLDAARIMARAGDAGATPRFRAVAADLLRQARTIDAVEVWREAVAFDPADDQSRAALIRTALDAGDVEAAVSWLPPEVDGAHPLAALAVEALGWSGEADRLATIVGPWLAAGGQEARTKARTLAGAVLADGSRECAWRLVESLLEVNPAEPDPEDLELARAVEAFRVAAPEAPQTDAEVEADVGVTTAPSDVATVAHPATSSVDGLALAGDANQESQAQVVTEVDLTPRLDALAREARRASVAAEPASPGDGEPSLDESSDEEVALSVEADDGGSEGSGVDEVDEPDLESARTTEVVNDTELDKVFSNLRDQVVPAPFEPGGAQLALGRTYRAAGMLAEAAVAFERATRDVVCRFEACVSLGEACEAQGDVALAVQWYERAVEVPGDQGDARHEALYRLADLLESSNERLRALAVWLELQSLSPRYRDVRQRVARAAEGGAAFIP